MTKRNIYKIIMTLMLLSLPFWTSAQVAYSTQLKNKARSGNPQAQLDLGICYAEGLGVGQNDSLAFHWFKKSADQGNVKACAKLGNYYCNGLGCNMNCKEGLNYLRQASAKGDIEAKKMLAFLTSDKTIVEIPDINIFGLWMPSNFEIKRNLSKVTKAANGNNILALFYLGSLNYDNNEYSKAVIYFKKAYDIVFSNYKSLNDAPSSLIEPNDPLEMEGPTDATILNICDFLGWCYEKGLGVQKNINTAIKYYASGTLEYRNWHGGDSNCMNGLFREIACYNEIGQINKGMELLDSINNENVHPLSYILRGETFLLGEGTNKDYVKAKDYYEKAVEFKDYYGEGYMTTYSKEYASACYRLYQIYNKGLGCIANTKMATLCFNESLKYGCWAAMYDDQRNYEEKN